MSVLGTGLTYKVETIVDGVVVDTSIEHNLLPQAAIDHVAGMIRGSGPVPISSWYVGLFEGNYVPTSDITATGLQNTVGECLAYDEATRPVWQTEYDGVALIANASNIAEFTINAQKTVYGAFIVSNATKGGSAGLLFSIARFSTAKQVDAGTVLRVTAGLSLTPTTP